MITGRDFVFFSDTLGDIPTSTYHLAKHIAKENRVFWINMLCRFPTFSQLDLWKVSNTLMSWIGRPVLKDSRLSKHTGIIEMSPIMVPLFHPVFREINKKLLLQSYYKIQDRFNIVKPIVVSTFPTLVDTFSHFEHYTKIYYCVDDYLNYPGIHHKQWRDMEVSMFNFVDGLVVTSSHLKNKAPRSFPMLHLPHGVDLEHFNIPYRSSRIFQIDQLPRPIVGFFGLISDWVDLELIAYLAESFPLVTFLIIGRPEISLDPIMGKPNILIQNHVSYFDLPEYSSYFDVGLIPFKINELTKAVNPLKMLEYFAIGLPVVASNLPDLQRLSGPIYLATSKLEFRSSLNKALSNLSTVRDTSAISIAKANSWQSRVNSLYQFIFSVENNLRACG